LFSSGFFPSQLVIFRGFFVETRVTYINLQDNPAEQASAEGQLLVNKKLSAPLLLIDGEPRFSGIILA